MKYTLLFLIVVLLSACGNDFLTLEPQSEANTEVFYKTPEDFKTAINGIYASLRSYPNMYFEMSSFRSDELVLGAPTAGTQDRYDFDKFLDNASNGILLSVWRDLYNGIALCNEVISRLKGVDFDEELKRQYEAEARFVRGYHYYNLVNFWRSVPLVLEPHTPAQALRAGQANVDDVFAAIESDLTYASSVENLPSSFSGDEAGRATSTAAKALLAKTYLTQGKFQEAGELLEPLVSSTGGYGLLENVTDVFSAENKMNKEVIFAIRYNKDYEGQGHGLWLSSTSENASQVPPILIESYEDQDNRKQLLQMVRSGSSGNSYVPLKFLDTYSTVNTSQVGNDYILLRYADILLMYAESANEVSYVPTGVAMGALNDVRIRAGLSAYTAADLPHQEAFRAAVWKERWLELPYEGHRWMDLIRTDRAISVMADAENLDIPAYRLVYPIPNNEIEKINDPSLMKQNEGY